MISGIVSKQAVEVLFILEFVSAESGFEIAQPKHMSGI